VLETEEFSENVYVKPLAKLAPSFLVFDANQRLVYWAIRPEDDCALLEKILEIGIDVEMLTAKALTGGIIDPEGERLIPYLTQRLEHFNSGSSSFRCRLSGNRWFRMADQRGADGTTLTTMINVTEIERREKALSLLVGEQSNDVSIFDRAARALSVGLNFKVTAVAQLNEDGESADTLSILNHDKPAAQRQLMINRTPCEPVYKEGYFEFSGDFLKRFPLINLDTYFSGLANGSYVGQVIYNAEKQPIGHLLAIDETERKLDAEDRRLIRLISEYVGFEIERLKTAITLEEAKNAAEYADSSKSSLLANVSHELRTPLNAIIGFSEVMRNQILGPILNPKYREYIEDIHKSGEHLLEMINDILDFSKIEAGHLELYDESIDLGEAINAVVRLLRDQATNAELEVVPLVAEDLPQLKGDTRRLKQVLINLVSNAIKFTPAGGSIEITAENASDGIDLIVKDTGIGIPESEIERVMLPFAQVDNAMSRQHNGTGLGLPLAKRLVELHGGDFHLESEVGKGTRITAHFPQTSLVREEKAA
jgi:signal transduction histidine kinase